MNIKKQLKQSQFEYGQIVKKNKSLIKLALVYPNTYETGMSNLGFQKVYSLINELDNVMCERVFLPTFKSKSNKTKSNKTKSNKIISCETGTNLIKFDIIAFSVSFENDYFNLALMLKNAGIPLKSFNRNKSHPLIIAGGIACFLNPEPIAYFIDCFLLGEAEFLIKEFFDIYDLKISKHENKKKLTKKIKGIYVPDFYKSKYTEKGRFAGTFPIKKYAPKKIVKRYIKDLSKTKTVTKIFTSKTVFKNTFLIEIGRGCPHGCRFCSAGFIYRPVRFYSKDIIISAINDSEKFTKKIGLVSAAVSDHPKINEICSHAIQNNHIISFSSFRLDALTNDLLKTIKNSGSKSVAIAPEAGSKRMQKIINKKITEKQILDAVKNLVNSGIINIKLYFMIGLPFETNDDVKEIVFLTEKIKQVFLKQSKNNKKIGRITLSINPFIPKPFTPFQYAPMATVSILKKKLNIIKNGLKKNPDIKIKCESFKIAKINALLSRGDRKTSDIIELALEKGLSFAIKQNQNYCDFKLYSDKNPDEPLPWDIIDMGIKKDFFLKEYNLAKNEQQTPDCPMINCKDCRICR